MKSMYATFHLSSADEITVDILETIRATFKSKPITITVEEELDTTAYLMSSPANKAMLDKSLEQHAKGETIRIKHGEL
jgi:hypothetical protein